MAVMPRRALRIVAASTLLALSATAAKAVAASVFGAHFHPRSDSTAVASPDVVAWDVDAVHTIATPLPTTATPDISARPVPAVFPSVPPQRSVTAPPPALTRSRLVSADGRLDTAVGVYSDCSGATPLPRWQGAVDTCITDRTYFVGHSPGAFSPLFDENVGATIAWWDAAGVLHPLRIVARRDWTRGDGAPPPPVSADVVAQFQTCIDSFGSQELILDATAA